MKTYLNSIFTNDLKRKAFFRKMLIVTDLFFLNKANYSDTEAPFLDLYFSITNGIVSL